MAWLVGSSDVAHLRQDLYDLLTGAVAAGQRGAGQGGNAAQAAGDDAWEGLDPDEFVVRSKYAEDSWRLPLACYRGMPRRVLVNTYTTLDDPVKGKPTFSGAYSGAIRDWIVCTIKTVNTNPGDLTGTVITRDFGTDVAGWSGASDTKVLRDGVSLTLSLQAGEMLTNSRCLYWRAYSPDYPQGIDYIPEFGCLKSADPPVVAANSDGSGPYTLDTDYKVVREADTYPTPFQFSSDFNGLDWGGIGDYYGVEWQASGSPPAAGGAYHLTGCPCHPACFAFNLVGVNFCMQPIQSWDPVKKLGRFPLQGATDLTRFEWTTINPYSAIFSAAPLSSYAIDYWMSVKSDKVVIVLQGDPANGGTVQAFTLQRYTPFGTWDAWPWVFAQSTAWAWGACQPMLLGRINYDSPQYGIPGVASTSYQTFWNYNNSVTQLNSNLANWPECNPSSVDDRWRFYPIRLVSPTGGKGTAGTYTAVARPCGVRGTFRGIWAGAQDNWTHPNEVVDGSDRYLLVTTGAGFGAIAGLTKLAILEE